MLRNHFHTTPLQLVIPLWQHQDSRASAKGWRIQKIRTIEHMIQKVKLQFDLSSYNKLQSEMIALEKQIVTMRKIAEQLLAMNSELSADHDRESLESERGFQKTVNDTFDLSQETGDKKPNLVQDVLTSE